MITSFTATTKYRSLIVRETSATSSRPMNVPSTRPSAAPTTPSISASVRIIVSTRDRVAPSARSTPMSRRRCTTAKLTALKIRNTPTSNASRLMACRFVVNAAVMSRLCFVRRSAGCSNTPRGNRA